MALSALGETINLMTLGGLALAVGILVDDATVTIENMERYLEDGQPLREAIVNGASQIAVPALVSTLCICIVFVPMFLLQGVARYLFMPLAEAVVFAMLASYFLSRTLVPTMAMYLLRHKGHAPAPTRNPLAMFQRRFERGFERTRYAYRDLLALLVRRRLLFIPAFLAFCLALFALAPWLGQDFFPNTDSGQFILHMRAKTGTRIEETARLADQVETAMRRVIPARELDTIVDNIGLPYSGMNLTHTATGVIGAADADIMVSLKPDHHPTARYLAAIRRMVAQEFPGVTFYSLPADMITQILNFGMPSPIDIQIDGADVRDNRVVADRILDEVRQVPGVVDARIQQRFDYPDLDIDVDRTKAEQNGLTERDVAGSLLETLSGSFQTTPMFFLNWRNGVNYQVAAQAPQYDIQSLHDIRNIPITGSSGSRAILADVATISRSQEMAAVDHYNIRRVVDVYANVQGRDLGAVGRDITRIVDANRGRLPRGSFVTIRGQLETMRGAYISLAAGLGFSILLVYLLIVVNFQSWLDPFIIITALFGALGGIVLVSVPHRDDAQRACAHGRHHVHGRRDRKQHPLGVIRPRAAGRARRRGPRRARGRLHPVPARADDGAGDDHRHGADVAWSRRGRRAERPAGAGGDRRPHACNGRDAGVRSGRLLPAARAARASAGRGSWRPSRRRVRSFDIAC